MPASRTQRFNFEIELNGFYIFRTIYIYENINFPKYFNLKKFSPDIGFTSILISKIMLGYSQIVGRGHSLHTVAVAINKCSGERQQLEEEKWVGRKG